MKITMTINLPEDFTSEEIIEYKRAMASMAGFYIKDIIKYRAEDIAEAVKKNVSWEVQNTYKATTW